MAKQTRTITLTRNYLYKWILQTWVINRAIPDPIDKERVTVTILCGGGSRAGKTYSIANVIYTIMRSFADTKMKAARPLHIIVYRDTLVSARDTYKDFIECYQGMGLLEGQDEQIKRGEADYKTTNSANVKIEMYGHTIEFKGLPDDGKEPTGCDIAFINELIEHKNQSMFDRISRKVRLLVMADWNPKDSVHFAYDMIGHNIFYSTTVYWDNKHLPDGLKAKAEKECPWDFNDCELYLETHGARGEQIFKKLPEGFNFQDWKAGNYPFDGFIRRRWLKKERPENCKEEDFHLYRGINKQNELNGTINRSLWLTYGEGIPSGQEGAIFHDAKWVDKFPDEVDNCHFGLDFGYSNDPSALVRCGNIGMDMYIEKLAYQCTATSDLLFDLIERPLKNEEKRRYIEANSEQWYDRLCELRQEYIEVSAKKYENSEKRLEAVALAKEKLYDFKESGVHIDRIIVVCDTADIYKGRGAMEEQQFVNDLNVLSVKYGYYWNFMKVGAKPIVPGISLMKKFNIHLVKDFKIDSEKSQFKSEQQNYVYIKDGAGKPTNIPDKDSKFNHIWDASRYCIWKMFKWIIN